MNSEIITAIGKLAPYVLALGVLVLVVHLWTEERSKQMEIDENRRGILVQTLIKSFDELNQDRDESRKLMRLLLEHFVNERGFNQQVVKRLVAIENHLAIQTRSTKSMQ